MITETFISTEIPHPYSKRNFRNNQSFRDNLPELSALPLSRNGAWLGATRM